MGGLSRAQLTLYNKKVTWSARMTIFTKTKPIPEQEAAGEIERIYYEIRQTLRVTGVP